MCLRVRFLILAWLNVFREDNEENLISDMFRALQLVQNDYIGGAGSRGSGQVKFEINSVESFDEAFYNGDGNEPPTLLTDTYRAQFPR